MTSAKDAVLGLVRARGQYGTGGYSPEVDAKLAAAESEYARTLDEATPQTSAARDAEVVRLAAAAAAQPALAAEAEAALVAATAARDAAVVSHQRAVAELAALTAQAATEDVDAATLSHTQAEVELAHLRLDAVVNDLATAQVAYDRFQVDELCTAASVGLEAAYGEVTHDLLALQVAATHYLQSVRGYGECRLRVMRPILAVATPQNTDRFRSDGGRIQLDGALVSDITKGAAVSCIAAIAPVIMLAPELRELGDELVGVSRYQNHLPLKNHPKPDPIEPNTSV